MTGILTVTVAGTSYPVRDGSFKLSDRVNDKLACTFTLLDATGTAAFSKGQTVSVTDDTFGTLFSGYVNKPMCTNLFPNPDNVWSMDCVNQFYVPAKRATTSTTGTRKHRGGKHANQHAGAIAALQIQEYLAPEGVNGNFALDWSELQDDWNSGTLSGTTGTTNASTGNVNAGDLELTLAGTPYTHVEQYTSDWNSGTLSSVVAANNTVSLNGRQGIMLTGVNAGQGNNAYSYYSIWSGSYTIVSGDHLQYYLWINASSPAIQSGVDGVCSDGTTIRDYSFSSSPVLYISDQHHFRSHPNTDLKGWADNQWYYRDIDLSPLAGKTLSIVTVAFEGDAQGTYTSYFHDIYVKNGTTTKITVYNGGSLNYSAQAQKSGYNGTSITLPTVYDQSGYRISPSTSLSAVSIYQGSTINSTSVIPAGTSLTINSSFDGGATWQTTTNQQALPDLAPGMALSGISLQTQEILQITGNDPTSTPVLEYLSWTINPTYTATKSDLISTYNSSTSLNTGTYTNALLQTSQPTNTPTWLQYGATQAVSLNGIWRDWDDGFLTSQTIYGQTGYGQYGYYGQLQLNTNGSGNDVRSQFNFAGQWQNFTASINLQIPTTGSENVGLVYRTTGWNNTNNTYAYAIEVTQSQIVIAKGSNGGSGSYTQISPVAISLAAGSWHILKVVVNGNSHTVYLDEVQYISATDSTYTAAGYLGVRAFDGDSVPHVYLYDDFGVVSSLTGTWQSPAISLNSVGTVGTSLLQWQNPPLPNGCALVATTSIDGGSTWQSVTNGGAIAGLSSGTSTSGVSLLTRFTLSAGNATTSPAFNAFSVLVTSSYNSSGTRISPSLTLTNAGRAINSVSNWNGNVPTNTAIGVSVSTDSGTTWQSVTSAGNAIPGVSTLLFSTLALQKQPTRLYYLGESTGTTAYDSSTSGQNGTISGGVTLGVTGGLLGPGETSFTAMSFDGSSGKITLPTSGLPSGTHAWSVFAWVRLASTPAGYQNVLSWGHYVSGGSVEFGFDGSGRAFVGFAFLGGPNGGVLSNNIWHFLAGTFDGTTLNMYVDGVLSASGAFAGNISTTSEVAYIGNGADGSTWFAGQAMMVGLTSTTLTASDISGLYNAGMSSINNGVTDTYSLAWTNQDIGSVAASGSTSIGFPTWSIAGSGGDIWGTADSFQFAYQASSSNMSVSAHVDSQTNTNTNAKAGVMIRQSTNASDLFYDAVATPGGNIDVHYRATSGGSAVQATSISGSTPCWLKVANTGTTFTAYTSSDGVTWTLIVGSTVTLSMSGTMLAGLAVTSHNNGVLSTATFDSVAFNGALVLPYTSTYGSGGSAATWTWDSTNSRVIASGGSNAVLLYNALGAYDTDMVVDLYQAENAGIVWGWQNSSNYYELIVKDSGASSGANTITINKISGGTSTQLTTGSIAFTAQTHHRIHLTLLATGGSLYGVGLYGVGTYGFALGDATISVSFDENQILSYVDSSPFLAGQAGLRADTGTSYIYMLQITPQPLNISGKTLLTKHTLTSSDPTVTPQLTDHQSLVSDPTIGVGALVPSVDYRSAYVSDNLDDLNTKSNYWWQVSNSSNVVFQAPSATNSPYILQSSDILVSTLPTVEYSSDLYRNQQVLKGVYQTATFVETKNGDNQTRTWSVVNPIVAVPTILLNGVSAAVGIQGTDTGKQFYYQLNSTSITQDSSLPILRFGIDSFVITYTGSYGIDFTLDNTGQYAGTISQAQMAAKDGTSGIVAAIEDVSQQNLNLSAATDYANQLLQRYGSIARTITFQTLHAGLKCGQSIPIFIPQLNIFDSVFLIVQVDTVPRTLSSGNVQYVYQVVASETAALSSWVKLFSKILRSVTGSKARL